MFITVPLIVIAVATTMLVVMVLRKWPYLKKLEPDAHPVGDSLVHDLAPEAIGRVKSIDWQSLWHHGLDGIEGALSGIRSAFTAIGEASERLKSSVQSVKRSVPERTETHEPETEPERPTVVVPARDDEAEQERLLREEEQKLILDIAQNPKNVELYKKLSRVYSKLDNLPDAIEALTAASKLDPDDDAMLERLDRLKERSEKEKEKEKRTEEKKEEEPPEESEEKSDSKEKTDE